MEDRATILAWVLLVFVCGSGLFAAEDAGRAAPSTSAAARVLAAAAQVLATLKHTAYSHVSRVREEAGEYDLDCSGLVVYLLRKAAPECLACIPVARGKRRPRAREFEKAFSQAPALSETRAGAPWRRIERLRDARPGDFLAWRFRRRHARGDTGHIMLILARPVREKNGLIRVRVLDSTRSPHADDSRPARGPGGVGTGTLWFTVDAGGRPAGYRWASRNGRPHRAPIAIGRPVAPSLPRRSPGLAPARFGPTRSPAPEAAPLETETHDNVKTGP